MSDNQNKIIRSFSWQSASNESYEETNNQNAKTIRELGLDTVNPTIAAATTDLETWNEHFTTRLAADRKQKFTKERNDWDDRRDLIRSSIIGGIKGSATFDLDAEKQQAAEQLLPLVEKYGMAVNRLGYSEQTAVVRRELADYRDNAIATAVAKMGLGPSLDALEAANEKVDEFVRKEAQSEPASPTADDADVEPLPLMRECKDELSSLNTTILTVAAYHAEKGESPYREAMDQFYARITAAQALKKRREGDEGGGGDGESS
ncbi:MAG: hypothetical protein ACI8UO_001600 [Verrucomicrobiales bacterium]|jgi:hypothetical protein